MIIGAEQHLLKATEHTDSTLKEIPEVVEMPRENDNQNNLEIEQPDIP